MSRRNCAYKQNELGHTVFNIPSIILSTEMPKLSFIAISSLVLTGNGKNPASLGPGV